MSPKVDTDKSGLLLKYLGRAYYTLSEKEQSRRVLTEKLKQLKKSGTRELREHIKKLENKIDNALRKEKQALETEEHERKYHNRLKKRLQKLESRLDDFLAMHSSEDRKKVHKLLEMARRLHKIQAELKRIDTPKADRMIDRVNTATDKIRSIIQQESTIEA